jgi:hypothetical protein
MRRPESRGFFCGQHFPTPLPRSRELNVCIHGNGSPFCLAALSGQLPLARKGRAFWREGLTAKARAERQ